MTQIESWSGQSKKASCQLAKFHYHLTNTIPELFPQSDTPTSLQPVPILQSRRGQRNMTFFFAEHCTEGVSSLDAQAILESARKLYISSECVRVGGGCFRKSTNYKVPYLPLYGSFHEIIEFHLQDKNEAPSARSAVRRRPASSALQAKKVEDDITSKAPPVRLPNHFQLFVIHHCHIDPQQEGRNMRWESTQFIERYRFFEDGEGDTRHKIQYTLLLNFEEEEGMFNYFSPTNRLYESFLADYVTKTEGGLQNLNRLQGFLLLSKERVDKKLRELNDPSFQENHKRWLKLPSEYFKMFSTLKKHVVSYYNSIHSEPAHPDHFLSNLICRYMVAKEYNHKETLQATMDYLKWQKTMADSYSLTQFAHIHKIDFFTFLGYDYQGRTVILNRAANLKVDEITDIEEYCIYYMYYMEIWMQRKWKGFADQYTVIADLQGLGSDNFKLAITKRNLGDGLKYSPQRQHKLIVVNVGAFANFVWSLLKPLIPKRTVHKLSMVGTDRAEILELLTKEMDISVVPQYLGGNNTRIYSDDFSDQAETHPITTSQ